MARAILPENTIEVFRYAIKAGGDAIELDVAVTKDNALVVSHDQTLNTAICTFPDGSRVIRELAVAEVRRWDCGSRRNPQFPKQKAAPSAKAPTLARISHQPTPRIGGC